MKKWRLLLAAAMSATILLTSVAASACPRGYAPCGERQQLCCPMR